MNFDPTAEQLRWRDLARDFAQATIRPRAADLDREQQFSRTRSWRRWRDSA